MAEETFSLAVENLRNFLIQKTDILLGVEEQVKQLKDDLERLQYFLKDANWISQLREAAQDAEDIIETFSFKAAAAKRSRRRLLGRFVGSTSKTAHNRDWVVREIDSIQIRLREVGERYISRFSGVDYVPTSLWHNVEQVVGMEQDVKMVQDRAILAGRIGLSVAAVVGLGGIGKTTLARLVYDDVAVVDQFECCAWVFVSGNFSVEEIVKEMVRQLLKPDEDELRILETIGFRLSIRRRLSGKRYLVVLDDVWDYAHLVALLSIFPDEGNGSRLLITSCNRDVAKEAQYVHEMKILDPSKSWKLLLKTAFFRDEDCRNYAERIGREILRKCHGFPSAIKDVGRLLVERQSASEWEDVLRTMDLSVMSNVFDSSYQRLSSQLKLCFLCLAFFRQGTTIRAEKLVQVWIAGGMVRQGEHMEEIAASYLDGLISRYMVIVEEKTKDDRVKNCRIYDVFHKPSIKKAEDEISLEILTEEGSSRPVHKPRHRTIYYTRASFNYSMNQDNFLRSLFFHGGGSFDHTPSYWNSFELLKVLDFEGFGLEEFPEAISSLSGLRYLGLRNNYIREVPNSLGRLECLEVLDISLNFAIVLPNVLWRMKRLRHLYMSEMICRGGLKIDTLMNLRTLAYISVDNWTYKRSSLRMMTSLRKLGVEELSEHSDVSNLFASLAHMDNLACLNLRGSRFNRMPSLNEVGHLGNLVQLKINGLLTALPDFPPNLCYLTLVNTCLDQDPMQVLEELPKLMYLRLRNAYTGDVMVISQEGFLRLQVLRMGELWHLRNVCVDEGAMPMLRRWEINGCPYLENLPRRAAIID